MFYTEEILQSITSTSAPSHRSTAEDHRLTSHTDSRIDPTTSQGARSAQ